MTTSEKMCQTILDYYKERYNTIKVRGIFGEDAKYYIFNDKTRCLSFFYYNITDEYKSIVDKYKEIIRAKNIKDILE